MAASSWGEYIARLPAEVRAMVDCLAEEEQEAFSYLASYSAFDHHHSSTSTSTSNTNSGGIGKGSKKSKSRNPQQNPKIISKEGHERAFGCECLDCYLKYWHLWVSSPNTQVIDKALELLELKSTSTSSSSSRSPWKKSKAHKPKKGNCRKSKEPPEVSSSPQEANKEDPECGVVIEKKPSPPPPKPRSSKQVAPLDFSFKEGELLEVVEDAGGASAGDGGGGEEMVVARAPGKSQSFGNRASEALGFVCEKLLWMWNPRFRRRQ